MPNAPPPSRHSITHAPASVRVLEAVGQAEGTDPLEFERPLETVIDTDALDSLFESGTGVSVQFSYRGHRITIEKDGSVTVSDVRNRTDEA